MSHPYTSYNSYSNQNSNQSERQQAPFYQHDLPNRAYHGNGVPTGYPPTDQYGHPVSYQYQPQQQYGPPPPHLPPTHQYPTSHQVVPAQVQYGHPPAHTYHPGNSYPPTNPYPYQVQTPYQPSTEPVHIDHQNPYPPGPNPTPIPTIQHPASSTSYPVIDSNESQATPAPAPVPAPRRITLKIPPKSTFQQRNKMPRRDVDVDDYEFHSRPTRSSRQTQKTISYADPVDDEDEFNERLEGDDDHGDHREPEVNRSTSGRNRRPPARYNEDDFENKLLHTSPIKPEPKRNGRSSRSRGDEEPEYEPEIPTRRKAFPPRQPPIQDAGLDMFDDDDNGPPPPIDTQETTMTDTTPRKAGQRGKSRQSSEGSFEPDQSEGQTEQSESDDPIANDFIQDDENSDELESDYGNVRAAPPRRKTRQPARRPKTRTSTRSSARTRGSRNRQSDLEEEDDDGIPFKKRLRERKSAVNYALPPADLSAEILQDAIATASRPNGRPGVGRANGVRFGGVTGKALPWSARGRDLAQAMGDPDTSDSDDFATPSKGSAAGGPKPVAAGGAGRGGGGGGPSTDVVNFGRINPKSSTADADPLGVDMNITFDNVGGLDSHINQLKEMVALPLLYPELFQQFGITPPRGVLFHGPPGTGKTLLARALAASCSTGNTKIAFFMRKGADVLSKWVGEAERQLRMLFEEARAAQPSIIFFDEIDGLAPVRSSKQDQIHASLVSTLLALMDGMDGRGQVIVIGATNRPDAVDPALRRPGRFDREFYFPLPNKEARKKIIGINTKKWTPQLAEPVLDQLAGMTKGYGGADLRALCTEAALNAIQRRYPQIYKTSDRLLLRPESIQVQAKDFLLSVQKIVPSSARSTSSAAAPIPLHLLPLLSGSLNDLKKVVNNALPSKRNVSALEEAEFEEEEGDSFAKHSMLQSLDKMRTYRPRILIHGQAGMGQAWLGPAILHHLEGFHVQSLDLGTLMGDSSRTVEAGLVQLFVEAKRHQPSVIFIPSLIQWASAISDTARSTLRALLDGVPASDPILILALVDGELKGLPRDIRQWFGLGKGNRLLLDTPSSTERTEYFSEIIRVISMPPTEFPDAIPRRRRVLEILPAAPPLPPREKTDAEIARENEKDVQAREMMIISFTGLIQDFMRKFRKVTATVREDAMALSAELQEDAALDAAAAVAEDVVNGDAVGDDMAVESLPIEDGVAPLATEIIAERVPAGSTLLASTDSLSTDPLAFSQPLNPTTTDPIPTPGPSTTVKKTWQAHNLDIDIISLKLSKHKYLTPSDFLADISKIEENAEKLCDPERITKIGEMGAHARMHVLNFDPAWEPRFEAYAERVRDRKQKRQKQKEEKKAGEVGLESGPGEVVDVRDGDGEGEGSLKRPREEEVDGEERGEKRHKEDIIMAEPPISIDTVTSIQSPPPVAEPTIPAPRPSYPPFTLPPQSLTNLSTTLTHATASFNIEQLEQLRAACFDTIWKYRADWDRTVCLGVVGKVVEGFVGEVEELREELDDYGA